MSDNIYIADKTTKAIEISAIAFAEGEYKRREVVESTIVSSIILKTNESEKKNIYIYK